MLDDSYEENGLVDGDTMKQLKSENFKFVSKRKFNSKFKEFDENDIADDPVEEDDEDEDDIKDNKDKNPQEKKPKKPMKKIKAVRVTMDEGLEYMADVTDIEGTHQGDFPPAIVEDDIPEDLAVNANSAFIDPIHVIILATRACTTGPINSWERWTTDPEKGLHRYCDFANVCPNRRSLYVQQRPLATTLDTCSRSFPLGIFHL